MLFNQIPIYINMYSGTPTTNIDNNISMSKFVPGLNVIRLNLKTNNLDYRYNKHHANQSSTYEVFKNIIGYNHNIIYN